ncbi:MAG: glycosyltransferase [Phycisphaerae bacterium]|nr:glycosyltransferase [Phycisphaerae bacterium]
MSRQLTAPFAFTGSSTARREVAQPATGELVAKGVILVLAAIALAVSLRSGVLIRNPFDWSNSSMAWSFLVMSTIWACIWYSALIWRVRLWLKYRPMESVADADLPSVSVIIPAYNEGALVRASIRSVAGSRYPVDKLQMIVIDDGSTDDTWEHIQAAVAEIDSTIDVAVFQQPRNMGKRHALFAGFRRATGEVIVTIDSDSILQPDALRNGVTPLVREPDIGAVAGCVEVLNPNDSMFTRFLKCTFSLSFKFVRAYQSEFRGVFCTPGAMSVYRASVVRKVADEWLHQRFLGQACTTGEDRAMTNLILREGWLTAYQENAVVRSQMPTTYQGTCKMLLRWARSNIRETIVLQRFLFTPFRTKHVGAFRLNMTLVLLTLIVPYLLIGNSWMLIATNGEYALRHVGMLVVNALSMALIYYRKERDSDWIWLLLYEVFWVISLSWIMPYALLTLKNTGWLTRGAPARTPAARPAVARPAVAMASPAMASVAASVAVASAAAVSSVSGVMSTRTAEAAVAAAEAAVTQAA